MPRLTTDTVPYPPGPDPESLSLRGLRLPAGVRIQEFLLLGTCAFLVLLHTTAIVASLAAAIWLAFEIPGGNTLEIMACTCGIAFSLILFRWLLKSLLSVQAKWRPQPLIEVTIEEQPGLYAFLQRVCDDVGAKMPQRVWLNPEANAAIMQNISLRNLIHSPSHDLTLGLALVNGLNLSELQAVLAHEFGHVRERNPLFAWGQGVSQIAEQLPIMRLCRGTLRLVREGLQREREYQADRFAAYVAGTDAAVRALRGADAARDALSDALAVVREGIDRNLITDDVYFHQHAAKQERAEDGDDHGEHPKLRDRIRRLAKAPIPAVIDERPPWLLFHDPGTLRRRMTLEYLKSRFKLPVPFQTVEARRVQQRYDDERSMPMLSPQYRGVYDKRLLHLSLREFIDVLEAAASEAWSAPRIREVHGKLYESVPARLARRQRIVEQRRRALESVRSVSDFEDADTCAVRLRRLDEWFHALDRRVAIVHLQMASQCDRKEMLTELYRLQIALQSLVLDELASLEAWLRFDTGKDHNAYREFVVALRLSRKRLANVLQQAAEIPEQSLRHLPECRDLPAYLLDEPVVEELPAGPLNLTWVGNLRRQLQRVERRAWRVSMLNLAELLKQQEAIAAEWNTQIDEHFPPKTTMEEKLSEAAS